MDARCRDIHTTYFGDTVKKNDTYSKEEQKELARDYNLENKARYAENMARKYDRMAQYSLDEDNQKMYVVRANVWDNRKEDISYGIDYMGKSKIFDEAEINLIQSYIEEFPSLINHIHFFIGKGFM